MMYHQPVLLSEALALLQLREEGIYVDATLGGGGHFSAMMKHITNGLYIGLDVDEDAILFNRKKLVREGFKKFITKTDSCIYGYRKDGITVMLCRRNFKDIDKVVLDIADIVKKEIKISGILFDFGVSSFQLDKPDKGFSYKRDAPLDMRMDANLGVTAADILNAAYEKELVHILQEYGEEIYAKRIAKGIIKGRLEKKITTSSQLTSIITGSVPFTYQKPYAKTFQALRIAVNSELPAIQEALGKLDVLIAPGGSVACISFHSLEDRLVKKYFHHNTNFREASGLIIPSPGEISKNKRARSAKLRGYIKI